MERLTLTWALERRRYGARTFGTPSRFLSEIPASLVVGSSPDAYEPPPSQGSGAAGRVLDYSVAQDEAAEAGGGGRGARVRHPIFGAGVVLESQGSGPGQQAPHPLRPRRHEDGDPALREPRVRVNGARCAAPLSAGRCTSGCTRARESRRASRSSCLRRRCGPRTRCRPRRCSKPSCATLAVISGSKPKRSSSMRDPLQHLAAEDLVAGLHVGEVQVGEHVREEWSGAGCRP